MAAERAEGSTGYGPSGRWSRLMFDGDERTYEQWEVKFLGYLKLRKLKDAILLPENSEEPENFAEKNEVVYAELIQLLDDRSLSLVMRDAADDGRAALKILRQHYAGRGKPRLISLYTELTTLQKNINDTVTDYIIKAETAATALKNAGETQLMNLSSLDYEEPSLRQFCVQADLLPVYVPTRVANQILFVGESVQMFENDKHKTQAQRIGSVLKNREQDFAKQLHELSKLAKFNCMEFETLIDEIRTYVAEHLWDLTVQQSGLCHQLRIMKDFFLLGRGELYLAFIDQAQNLLKTQPTGTTEHDVNMAYQQSARNVLLDDENFFQHFQLTITSKGVDKKAGTPEDGNMMETGWKCLGLSCSIQWPLHIFFTPNILKKYDEVFRFLLAVKKTQIELQSCWTLQMQHKNKSIQPSEAPTWQLRTHMMFLIDNLQYYLQVDVIESQYGILLDKINTTRDFEAVKQAHEQFLVTLLSQSFVHKRSVSSCLYDILELCTTFSRHVNESEVAGTTHNIQQIQTIAKNFQRQSSLLFKILSGVRSLKSSPHLAQLLLRLDFNRYFSTAGGQLGSI